MSQLLALPSPTRLPAAASPIAPPRRRPWWLLLALTAAGCGSGGGANTAFTLVPDAGLHGTVTPAATQTVRGATTLAATPAAGYAFAGWVATPADRATFTAGGDATTQVVLTGDATITATWVLASADLFVNARHGSDLAAGTSPGASFQTLTRALAAAHDGDTVAVAPGRYDSGNGETFPLVVPAGVTVLGDEDVLGRGTEVQGAAPLLSAPFYRTGIIASSRATIAGLHILTGMDAAIGLIYHAPTGGADIVVRHNSFEVPFPEGSGLYLLVSSGGAIVENEFTVSPTATFAFAMGTENVGAGTTSIAGNRFLAPVDCEGAPMDFGGGAAGSPGGNSFLGAAQSYFDGVISARNNRWKNAPPLVATTGSSLPTVYDYYLTPTGTIDTTGATN